MLKLLTAVATASLLAGVGNAYSQDAGSGGYFRNGNDLHSLCTSNQASHFVGGLYDGAQYVFTNSTDYFGPKFCSPRGTELKQYNDIVCSYVERHPESRQTQSAEIVALALSEAWPCQ